MVSRHKFLALGWILLLLCASAPAAVINAQLDRDRIVQGETVTLIIQTDDPQQNLDGDFSELEADFELLDRRSETQMSIVNGQQSAVVRLLLTLEPRRTGLLTIPPLHIGATTTTALALTVDAAPAAAPGEAPTVFIETEVEPKDGPYYVHAQLRLTVRVFYQQSLTEAAISQPEPAPASVRLLDEVPYQADRSGVRYRVLERRYAIFPERSGPLQIPPMKLTGRLVERRTDRLWQASVRGRRIEVNSDAVEVTIQPKPAGYTGDAWLPARSLQLTQTVSAGDQLTVGEPVTRTIMVDAVGLEENMLTEPPWPQVANARIYPDQPQGISRNDGKWVLGHKEFRYAVVPEQEGELVLPELRLQWWDTANDREQTAVLPEQRLLVLPSALAPPPPAVAAAAAVAPGSVPAAAAPTPAAGAAAAYWSWLTLLFAALWLGTSALLLRRHLPTRRQQPAQGGGAAGEDVLLNEIRQACAAGDAARARHVLGSWLRAFGPADAAGSLLQFAEESASEDLRQCLLELDASGFRPGQEAVWSGAGLWRSFAVWHRCRRGNPARSAAQVTDLYAEGAGGR
jgi:hypothetical protein